MQVNLTRPQIESMEAGREMDRAVEIALHGKPDGALIIPNYSTDIAAAMTLLKDRPYWENRNLYGKFSCTIYADVSQVTGHADTLPRAIAKARLLAALEMQKEDSK